MKTFFLCTAAALAASLAPLHAQGSKFTYQGHLEDANGLANGTYNFEVTLWDAVSGGNQIGTTKVFPGKTITDGKFVIALDFGSAAFDGGNRWLEIAIDDQNSGTFTPLTPRQRINPTPYAVRAGEVSGTIPTSQLSGTIDATNLSGTILESQIDSTIPRISGGNQFDGNQQYDGDLLVHDPTQNGALILSPSNAGPGIDPELVLQSAEGSAGENAPFHLSRNARYFTSDNKYRLVDAFEEASSLVFDNQGNIILRTAPSTDDAINNEPTWVEGIRIQNDGKVGIGITPTTDLEVDGEVKATSFSGDGSGLTGLDGATITTGVLDDQRLSSNIARLGSGNTFTATNNFEGTSRFKGTTEIKPPAETATSELSIIGRNSTTSVAMLRLDTTNVPGGSDFIIQGISIAAVPDANQVRIMDGTTQLLSVSATGGTLIEGRMTSDSVKITGGSDLAEPFDLRDGEDLLPGMVVAIDPDNPGGLKIAERAYDRTVAGILSGAGGVNPGIVLTQEDSPADGQHPVALSGRVYCYVDADEGGPVVPGDLLTTSDTPGHARKVTDHSLAPGATIGKAMTPLAEGRGLVLVLVNLQ